MLVLGDVVATVAILFGSCLAVWAGLLTIGLIFPQKASLARHRLESKPGTSFVLGLLMILLSSIPLALIGQPNPLMKVIGTVGLAFMLGLSLIGMAGFVLIVGNRMLEIESDVSKYRAYARAAGLIVVMNLMPVLGWFLVLPLMLIFSLGAGFSALISRIKPLTLNQNVSDVQREV